MKSKINKILSEIDNKKQELIWEYQKLMEKYDFSFIKWKVVFTKEAREKNKRFKKSIIDTIFSAQIREILSIPFIYAMIIPAFILDLFLFIYQQTAIRLYWIPLVKRSEYIVFDRKQLDYLNWLQKINCIYCSYFNGLMSYAVEVAWRTEKYWCPIKHAQKIKWWHDWQKHFADYWDHEWFKEVYHSTKEYYKN